MKFRPIIIILFISLLGSFQVNAAVKWNNSDDKSNVYNRELVDVGSLNQKEVPKSFPDYRITADESCKSTKSSWSNRITLYYSEGFLWAQRAWSKEAFIFEGKLKGTSNFEINVSSAAKSWSDKSTWIKYKFPKGVNFFDALREGVKGRYSKGNYSRSCILKQIMVLEFATQSKKKQALSALKSSQELILNKFQKFGVSKGYAYDFNPDSIQLAAPKLGDTQTCYIANKSPNAQWSAEKIKDAVREVKNRGLDCLENKPTSPSEPAEKIMQASGPKRDSKTNETKVLLQAELEKQRKDRKSVV